MTCLNTLKKSEHRVSEFSGKPIAQLYYPFSLSGLRIAGINWNRLAWKTLHSSIQQMSIEKFFQVYCKFRGAREVRLTLRQKVPLTKNRWMPYPDLLLRMLTNF